MDYGVYKLVLTYLLITSSPSKCIGFTTVRSKDATFNFFSSLNS